MESKSSRWFGRFSLFLRSLLRIATRSQISTICFRQATLPFLRKPFDPSMFTSTNNTMIFYGAKRNPAIDRLVSSRYFLPANFVRQASTRWESSLAAEMDWTKPNYSFFKCELFLLCSGASFSILAPATGRPAGRPAGLTARTKQKEKMRKEVKQNKNKTWELESLLNEW